MHRFYYSSLDENQNIIELTDEISFQIINVLRLRIMNNSYYLMAGYEAVFIIKKTKSITCKFHILLVQLMNQVKVKFIIGLCKPERFELILQKCTELGAFDFTPVITERVQGGENAYPSDKRLLRWRKIIKESAEQSGRTFIPKLNKPEILVEIIKQKIKHDKVLCLWEDFQGYTINQALDELTNIKSLYVVIGPPGGFSKQEAENLKKLGAKLVSLGKRILRTETAAIAVMTSIIYHYGDFRD